MVYRSQCVKRCESCRSDVGELAQTEALLLQIALHDFDSEFLVLAPQFPGGKKILMGNSLSP